MSLFDILSLVIGGLGVLLTGVYVFLTLRIANKTAESVRATQDSLALAREQLEISKKQSMDAAILSERQSKEAMQAIHEQIEASEKQNREQMENQFKPFILPDGKPESGDTIKYRLDLANHGAGIALKTWGFFTIRNSPLVHYFETAYSIKSHTKDTYKFVNKGIIYPTNVFEGYPIYLIGDENGIEQDIRLMITYSDIFNNKFLVVFDYGEELSWQLVDFKKIEQRLDELAIRKK